MVGSLGKNNAYFHGPGLAATGLAIGENGTVEPRDHSCIKTWLTFDHRPRYFPIDGNLLRVGPKYLIESKCMLGFLATYLDYPG